MLEPDEQLSEEHAHPELLQELQMMYRIRPEEEQVLSRVRERLVKSALPASAQEPAQPDLSTQTQGVLSSRPPTSPRPARRLWIRRFNLLVAVFVVALLVGSFAFTFSKINQFKNKGGNVGMSTYRAAGKTMVELTEGLRLSMVSDQVGWSVGDDLPTPYATVLRTTDGGKHWRNVTPPDVHEVGDLLVLDEQTAWVPVWDQTKSIYPVSLYRTVNGGATWQYYTCPSFLICIPTFIDQNHGWLIYNPQLKMSLPNKSQATPTPKSASGLPTKPTLYRTADGGKTWEPAGTLPFSGLKRVLRFINDQTGWISGGDFGKESFYVTHDGGRTWNVQSLPGRQGKQGQESPDVVSSITFLNEREGYLEAGFNFGQPGMSYYVYATQDGGKSWQIHGNALPGGDIKRILDMQHVVTGNTPGTGASGFGDIIMLTLKDGKWVKTLLSLPAKSPLVDYSFTSTEVGVALVDTSANSFDVYRTTDGGKTWQQVGTMPKIS